MEMSGSTSEIHVHCRGLSSIVEYGTTISVVDCVKFSVLVNQCRVFMWFRGSTYPQQQKNKAGHSPYNVSFMFYETCFFLSHDINLVL